MEAHTRSPPSLPARALPPEVILPCDLPSWPTVQARMLQLQVIYRVSLVVWQLGWVDLDLDNSPGWMAAIVATYCQSRMVEHLKSESTQPHCHTTWDTLYLSYDGTKLRFLMRMTTCKKVPKASH